MTGPFVSFRLIEDLGSCQLPVNRGFGIMQCGISHILLRLEECRLQNKFTHSKGIRNNTGSRQTTGIQEELDTAFKQNAS